MAQILSNGLIQFNDGQILYSDTPISGSHFMELQELLPKINPVIGRSAMVGFPFVSGGGAGAPGIQGPPGSAGAQGATGPQGNSGPSFIVSNAFYAITNVTSVIPGLTITPAAGTYMVFFDGWLQNLSGGVINPFFQIFKGGSLVPFSNKSVVLTAGLTVIVSVMSRVTVDGTQAIDVRTAGPAGSNLNESQLMIALTS